MLFRFLFCFKFVLLFLSFTAIAQKRPTQVLIINKTYQGKSIKVDDGDTFIFLDNKQHQHKIRLEGIDAPEKGMPYAKKSREYLSELLKNKSVHIKITGYDKYNRILARVLVNKKEVNLAMLNAGLAWHYKKYNKDAIYAEAEQKAQKNKIGLWQGARPLAPWIVRKYRRAGYSDAEFRSLLQQNNPIVNQFL